MFRHTPFLVAATLTGVMVSSIAANAQNITTSPSGFETTAAPSAGLRPFAGPSYRNQVLDTTLRGQSLVWLLAANFRRDESATAEPSAVARTADVTLRLGLGDVTRFQNRFDNNYIEAPTTVFERKTVNFPDWTVSTGSSPEPWSVRLPFDSIYDYFGTDALVWESIYENASQAGAYSADRAGPPAGELFNVAFGQDVGTGCTATGAAGQFTLVTTIYSHVGGNLMRVRAGAINAPASQPVLMNLSWLDENASIPGLCATYRAFPVYDFVMGFADAAGAVPEFYLPFPFQSVFVGQPMMAQAVSPDAGQTGIGVALSQGESMTFPTSPSTPADYALIYSADVNAADGTGPVLSIGSTVVGLEQR